MSPNKPKSLAQCRQFFVEPENGKQRMYEALRCYFVEGQPSREVARAFGYTPGSFRVLCHHFRRDLNPKFFNTSAPGPREQPRKSAARSLIETLRKQNRSVYEISESLKREGKPLSPTAVREVLKELGFAPLPRRLDQERAELPTTGNGPEPDPVPLALEPRRFETRCGGLFLFLPEFLHRDFAALARRARLPSLDGIPAEHALRACLALKLWAVQRRSRAGAVITDPGLGLLCGLNGLPKKSVLAKYSERIGGDRAAALLRAWNSREVNGASDPGLSFDLDFHALPSLHDPADRDVAPVDARRRPSMSVFLAHDTEARTFCYARPAVRKDEESEEIIRFVHSRKDDCGTYPEHLVFDSRLTTHTNLRRLDEMGISFITWRRRSPGTLRQINALPDTAWRPVTLDVPNCSVHTARVHEQPAPLAGASFRQLYVLGLGNDKPTVLLTNETCTQAELVARVVQRSVAESDIFDTVQFFHKNALSSAVGMQADLDLALLSVASGLYRSLAKRVSGYAEKPARQVFHDLVETPAEVEINEQEVRVRLRGGVCSTLASAPNLLDELQPVPWWNGLPLRLTV